MDLNLSLKDLSGYFSHTLHGLNQRISIQYVSDLHLLQRHYAS